MTLTPEQQEIYNRVQKVLNSKFESNVVVHVDAKAGTGKTFLAKYIVDKNPKARFIYAAFNRKIVEDGISKFGESHCKTFHALAYKFTTNPNIGGFYPNAVKDLGYTPYSTKKMVVDMLDKYCLSRHLNIDDFFIEQGVTNPIVQDLILVYLEKMADRTIPITFNYMLKELHHQLADGEIRIELDILFVDEAQDLTPVMLEIFGLIQSDVKIYLGDTCQDTYSFLDLVSAFTLSVDTYDLTTSFRLSSAIASKIEPFCKKYIDSNFKITGVSTTVDTTQAFITHTNAEIIEHISLRQRSGEGYSLTRPVKEIFEVAIAVNEILKGNKSKKPKYWVLVDKVKKGMDIKGLLQSEELDDDIISSLVLLKQFSNKGIDIMYILNKAEKSKPNRGYLIGTAHSVKGTEFGQVTISPGLNKYVRSQLKRDVITEEDEAEVVEACKLYYVACSRAKHDLINATELNK